ncbi:MAG TPA: CBS domain-containing protein [Gemmatimonadales bacterium]
MIVLLAVAAALIALVGGAYELALVSVSQAELAEAVNRRLRGGEDKLASPLATERELAAAAATASVGIVALGVLVPAVFTGESIFELLVLLVLLAVPFTLLSGYLLPRWLTHGRAERVVHLLQPVFRPWGRALGLVLPTPAADGEVAALSRESAAVMPETTAEMAMVGGVMTFAHRPVRDVMTPRTDLVAVAEGATAAEMSRTVAESGYTRLPVYRETLDEIVGMVHAFDLFRLQPGDRVPVRPVAFAPASRSCGDLLLDMQRERRHLAVVLDEFGGTLGIVTLEDLLTALVGEIYDEGEVRLPVEAGRPQLLELDGEATVADLEERFGVSLPPGQSVTLAGRLAELAGRIPPAGTRLLVSGLEVDVLQASPVRVERVVVRPEAPAPVRIGGPS